MTESINILLLAISHSFNLIIYCLSSKTFRKNVCFGIFRSNPEPTSDARVHTFGEDMRTVRETLLLVQQTLEKTEKSNLKDGI